MSFLGRTGRFLRNIFSVFVWNTQNWRMMGDSVCPSIRMYYLWNYVLNELLLNSALGGGLKVVRRNNLDPYRSILGHTMTQAVRLGASGSVPDISCQICVQTGTEVRFLLKIFGFLLAVIIPPLLHTHLSRPPTVNPNQAALHHTIGILVGA